MALEPNNLGENPPSSQPSQPSQPGNGTPPAGNAAAAPSDGSQPPAKATRPDWLPEAHWDNEGGTFKPEFGAHYNELATSHQAQADRLATIPKTPAEYDLGLADDLQMPEGLSRDDYALDEAAPEVKAFRDLLHAEKIAPDTAKKMVGLIAQRDAAQVARINKRVAEEQQLLGPNFGQRVAAVGTFLEARIGKPLTSAVMKGVFTADQVKAFEQLASIFSQQGAPKIPAAPHDQHVPDVPREKRMFPNMN